MNAAILLRGRDRTRPKMASPWRLTDTLWPQPYQGLVYSDLASRLLLRTQYQPEAYLGLRLEPSNPVTIYNDLNRPY